MAMTENEQPKEGEQKGQPDLSAFGQVVDYTTVIKNERKKEYKKLYEEIDKIYKKALEAKSEAIQLLNGLRNNLGLMSKTDKIIQFIFPGRVENFEYFIPGYQEPNDIAMLYTILEDELPIKEVYQNERENGVYKKAIKIEKGKGTVILSDEDTAIEEKINELIKKYSTESSK